MQASITVHCNTLYNTELYRCTEPVIARYSLLPDGRCPLWRDWCWLPAPQDMAGLWRRWHQQHRAQLLQLLQRSTQLSQLSRQLLSASPRDSSPEGAAEIESLRDRILNYHLKGQGQRMFARSPGSWSRVDRGDGLHRGGLHPGLSTLKHQNGCGSKNWRFEQISFKTHYPLDKKLLIFPYIFVKLFFPSIFWKTTTFLL